MTIIRDHPQRAVGDAKLTERIVALHAESNGTYGASRVHAELVAAGWRCSRKRVTGLMRQASLAGKTPKRWRTTTVPDPTATLPEDLIGRDFACAATDLNSRWCGDITYIHTWEGWLYLIASVIDLGWRRVVGWATADHLRTDLVEQGPAQRDHSTPARGWGDLSFRQGCQYTSGQYARLAGDNGVRLSVGHKG